MAQFDNYLPCEDYAGAPLSPKYPGFHAWQAEGGAYYFAAVSKRGQVQLRSEAYTTEEARDNGIESVMRNRDTEGRYKVVQEDGYWYLTLRAGNNQEIARSCAFDSEATATAAIATYFSTYQERSSSKGITDNYLPCEDYAGAPLSPKYPGFHAW
ncbi:MAG TPA: YegP family protein, partial [Saprospiraceae bacterium]|nr:YegP family protein [Saprospiraceae bacterium]